MKDMPTPAQSEDLETLLSQHVDGYAMARGFYTSPSVYEEDIKRYWNTSWIWVGHASQLPKAGHYFLFDYGPESVIVARNKKGEINAFLNICRHRGSRICTEAEGRVHAFSCPYHAWIYELDGRLRAAREMGENFDPARFGLFQVHLRVFQGLIFICTAETPLDIDSAIEKLGPLTAPFGFERMKRAHEARYPVPANWKLAVENYMECYHCGPAHLDYSRSHSLKDPASITPELSARLDAACARAGLPDSRLEHYAHDTETRQTEAFYGRYPLYDGYQTGSQTGALLAPLLGDLKEPFNGANDFQLGFLNNFLAYSDHVVGYRFVPRGVQETDIEVVWYVHEDAEEGRDYDKEALTWLWHVTSLDDERIIRLNQQGVNSNYFQPGPLSEMESFMRVFYDSYLGAMRAAL